MLETQQESPIAPLDFFRVKACESESPVSRANNTRATDMLEGFLQGSDLTFSDFTPSLLGELTTHLLFNGYATKTIAYNIKKLGALYNKAVAANLASPNAAFSQLHARLSSPLAARYDGIADKDTFRKLREVVLADYTRNPDLQLAKDILLLSIYSGGLTLTQIGDLKKDDYQGSDPHILEIINRYARPKNRYLFPLDRIHSTPRQMQRKLEAILTPLLRRVGLRLSPNSQNTLRDLWAASAIAVGIPHRDIAKCLSPHLSSSPLTAFIQPNPLAEGIPTPTAEAESHLPVADAETPHPVADTEQIEAIRQRVSRDLAENPIRWYAMHLRPHTTFSALEQRLREKNITLSEIYYPLEEIINKIGNRKVFEKRPVISWLVFYRTHISQQAPLYREIGDLAWGYRLTRTPGSPYAEISDSEITRYRQATAALEEDTTLLAPGEIELRPGDRLVILGGLFRGRTATFSAATRDKTGQRTIYRLLLDGGNYRDWLIEQSPAQVQKITESQYQALIPNSSSLIPNSSFPIPNS